MFLPFLVVRLDLNSEHYLQEVIKRLVGIISGRKDRAQNFIEDRLGSLPVMSG